MKRKNKADVFFPNVFRKPTMTVVDIVTLSLLVFNQGEENNTIPPLKKAEHIGTHSYMLCVLFLSYESPWSSEKAIKSYTASSQIY